MLASSCIKGVGHAHSRAGGRDGETAGRRPDLGGRRRRAGGWRERRPGERVRAARDRRAHRDGDRVGLGGGPRGAARPPAAQGRPLRAPAWQPGPWRRPPAAAPRQPLPDHPGDRRAAGAGDLAADLPGGPQPGQPPTAGPGERPGRVATIGGMGSDEGPVARRRPDGSPAAVATTPAAQARLEREQTPAPLRRYVRLLGGVLGRVLVESEGPELLADVERLRHAAIELRSTTDRETQLRQVVGIVAGLDLDRAESVARAFTVYFQLVNLAEEHYRARILRERSRGPGPPGPTGPAGAPGEPGSGPAPPREPVRESLAEAIAEVRATAGEGALAALLERLEVRPVLTAHPTEARRPAVVDDLRLSASEEADAHRRLLEEVTILWRTAQLRHQRPTALDEVRTVMSVFDETLFRLVPDLYRELDLALQGDRVGTRAPGLRPYLHWGSWVGGDRDGNPTVTAEVTRAALGIQAEHVLRGLEAVTRRVARSLSVSADSTPPSAPLLTSLGRDEVDLPALAAEIRKRAPDEPHRRKLILAAGRLAATRLRRPGAYVSTGAFLADLALVQESLAVAGAARLAYGELQHLRWQAETFGFHLASLEVRQHSGVHARVIEELAPASAGDAVALDRLARDGSPGPGPAASGSSQLADEVLATLRVMAELQARWGAEACRRYVVSFSRSAADLAAVRALGRLAVPDGSLELDVVPLFESRADLEAAPRVLDEYVALPGVAAWLDDHGRCVEVMLGYSDSAKDVGFLAANVALYRAQGELVAWARRSQVELTLFHGRGGALGRGGGPAGRAIRGQAPGSVAGRFKVTEQGEVLFARDANPAIGRRYRALVIRPGFVEYFMRVTPIEELSVLAFRSRRPRRSTGFPYATPRSRAGR